MGCGLMEALWCGSIEALWCGSIEALWCGSIEALWCSIKALWCSIKALISWSDKFWWPWCAPMVCASESDDLTNGLFTKAMIGWTAVQSVGWLIWWAVVPSKHWSGNWNAKRPFCQRCVLWLGSRWYSGVFVAGQQRCVSVSWQCVSVWWQCVSVSWQCVSVSWQCVSVSWQCASVSWQCVSVSWQLCVYWMLLIGC